MKKLRRVAKIVLSYFLFYSGALGLWQWARRRKKRGLFSVLMYHHITPDGKEGIPTSVFEKQMAWVQRRYPVVSLSRYLRDAKEGNPVPEGAVAITVDDGYRDFLTEAYPVLKKWGLPATLFVVVDCLDGKPLWTLSGKGKTAAMLRWDDVHRLAREGFEIGAHSVSHSILTQRPLQEAAYEIVESKQRLEKTLGRPVHLFCYPNGDAGDFNPQIQALVKEAGFLCSCTIIEGKNDASSDLYALKRVLTWERLLPVFACQLEGCFDFWSKPQRTLREEVEALYVRRPNRKPPVVVLGQSRTGVSTDQFFGRRGIEVVKVAGDPKCLGTYSRYGRFERIAVGNTGLLLSLLEKIKGRFGVAPVLIPTSDEAVQWLSDDRVLLQEKSSFFLPDKKIVNTLLDKSLFAVTAARLEIPAPKTVSVQRWEDLKSLFQDKSFPYVLKPSNGRPLGFGQEKALWIETESELEKVADRLIHEEIPFLVQEAIPGEDTCHWSCAVYLDETSCPLAVFTSQKIRQYPPLVGMASLCESRWNERVATEAVAILQKLNYAGVAEMEFKEDPRDGRLKLIEINPRLWVQHALAKRCGIDFAYMLYQGSLGIRPKKARRQKEGIRWLAPDLDLLTVRHLHREGKMNVSKWLGAYRFPLEADLYRLGDPGPALYQTAKLAKDFLFKERGGVS